MSIRYKHTIHSPLESPYGGASMVVESDSQTPPTAEQKQSIFEQVHGTGVDVAGMTLTKQDVPDALGMGGRYWGGIYTIQSIFIEKDSWYFCDCRCGWSGWRDWKAIFNTV